MTRYAFKTFIRSESSDPPLRQAVDFHILINLK